MLSAAYCNYISRFLFTTAYKRKIIGYYYTSVNEIKNAWLFCCVDIFLVFILNFSVLSDYLLDYDCFAQTILT